jgi:hypothetical protein
MVGREGMECESTGEGAWSQADADVGEVGKPVGSY